MSSTNTSNAENTSIEDVSAAGAATVDVVDSQLEAPSKSDPGRLPFDLFIPSRPDRAVAPSSLPEEGTAPKPEEVPFNLVVVSPYRSPVPMQVCTRLPDPILWFFPRCIFTHVRLSFRSCPPTLFLTSSTSSVSSRSCAT